MYFTYNDKDYEIVIEKKRTTKNTYIRVKKNLKIYVTSNIFTSNRFIENLIRDNYSKICKMIDFQEKKADNNKGFLYLGKKSIGSYE